MDTRCNFISKYHKQAGRDAIGSRCFPGVKAVQGSLDILQADAKLQVQARVHKNKCIQLHTLGLSRQNCKCVIDDAQTLSFQGVRRSPLNTCRHTHSRSSIFLTGISGLACSVHGTSESNYSVQP